MISMNTINAGHMSGPHLDAILAHAFMTSDDQKDSSIKKKWSKSGDKPALFKPVEIDLYADKATHESYVFHGKKIDYDNMDRLEYDPDLFTVDVIMKDGTVYDLGVKIQWLLRPYFTKAKEIMFVQTKDGKSLDGRQIPFIHKQKKQAKQ